MLAILGSAAIEGPVISWVADHRKHHAFSDKPGDPHSPHVDHGDGWRGALRGLFHAHVGWLFIHTQRGTRDALRARPDGRPGRSLRRPHVRAVGRSSACSSPFVLGWLIGGTLDGGADRPAVGRRRADARPAPRHVHHQLAVPLLRAPALRHRRRVAQPRVAVAASRSARRGTTTTTRSRPRPRHGLRRWEFDPPRCVIRGLEKVGLAWDVVRIDPERQAAKPLRDLVSRGPRNHRAAARRTRRDPP